LISQAPLIDEEEEPLVELSLTRIVPAECAGLRADLALGRLFPEYSRSRIQSWMREERVLVNAQAIGVRAKVWEGDVVDIPPPPDLNEDEVLPENIPLQLVYQDEGIFVVHKPAGLVVHPGSGNRSGTLQNGLLFMDAALGKVPRSGIVHRLDKDTSGLMVVARTLPVHTDLVRQLQARSVKRHYAAIAVGEIASDGVVNAPIGRHPTQRTKMAVVADGRPAITHYAIQEHLKGFTRVECRLETGRTHQIRVHMQKLGFPLVGDPVYGVSMARIKTFPEVAQVFSRQALHAFRLGLIHPLTQIPMEWEISLESDFQTLLDGLRATTNVST